jgi:NitT/TauT family transport system permease protein
MTSESGLARIVPVATVLAALTVVWYGAALPMNSGLPSFPAGGSLVERFVAAWSLDRPVLPAPHQIVAALWTATVETPVASPRSLVFHGAITLSSTLLGFAFGAVLGMVLAIGIVHVRTLQKSLMPWLIASQTIPILAIAPIVVVALGAAGITGLVPKALISMYLSFFPVAIGMVKGLTSPEPMLLDLIRTYSASRAQILLRLRLPAALPYLFASLKVAVAISLVGAIVGELPTGSSLGLGARLLSGSYYGQTVQIWAALFAAAILAACLVQIVALAERLTARAMGARP